MKKGSRRTQSRLGKKFLVNLFVLAVIICVVSSFAVGVYYRHITTEDYSNMAFHYAKAAAEFIDGDKIAQYLQNPTPDAYYEEILSFLNAEQRNSDLFYYYVFVPLEDDLVYIWDANTHEGACELGEHEAYIEGDKETAFLEFSKTPAENFSMTDDEVYGSLATAYVPLYDSAGEPVALVGVDLSVPAIHTQQLRFMLVIAGAVLLVLILSNGVFYFCIRRTLLQPLDLLTDTAKNAVNHLETEDELSLDIHTNDEVEDLANSFSSMFRSIRSYIARLSAVTAERERIGAELDVATHIQASMLPCIFPAFPRRDEFDVFATMDPAKEVGGDFYDFFMVDDRHLAFVVADVSGKGVPAALFMVIGKTLIKDHSSASRDLGAVFTEVNHLLCEANGEGMFITAFEGVMDLATGELVFVNAGHELPFVYKVGGDFEPQKIRAGFVLAGMDGVHYHAGKIQLEPGDKIYEYTDGVTEATDPQNQLFGMERLQVSLNKVREQSAEEILHSVKKDIDAFVGDAPQFDDITMLCIEYRKRMEI